MEQACSKKKTKGPVREIGYRQMAASLRMMDQMAGYKIKCDNLSETLFV